MDGSGGESLGKWENISRTSMPGATSCGFVVAGEGLGARFCDNPALGGGSYCARHAALCQVRPGTQAAALLIADLAREAKRAMAAPDRDEVSFPEPLEATEPDEVAAALDLPACGEEP